MAEFARIWRDMPKIVYSRTLTCGRLEHHRGPGGGAEEVLALKEQPGGDLALGGAELADTFRRLGLIDEYWLYVHPVLIGRGKPLFQACGQP